MVTIFISSMALLALLLLLLLCRSISALSDLFVEYALSAAMFFLIAIAVVGGMSILLGFFGTSDIVAVVLSIVAILIVGSMAVLSVAVYVVNIASAFLSGALDWAAAHLEQWFSGIIGFMEKRIDERGRKAGLISRKEFCRTTRLIYGK